MMRNPLQPIESALDRLVTWQNANERRGVTRWVVVRMMLLYLFFLATILVVGAEATLHWRGGVLSDVAQVMNVGFTLLAVFGCQHLAGMTRRLAYQHGYRDGRVAMWHSMAEAQRRGLSPGEWLMSEMERDTGVVLFERGVDDDI